MSEILDSNINLESLLNNIKQKTLVFVNQTFQLEINYVINDFFPNLNTIDKKVLYILVGFIVDIISFKYGFKNTEPYYYQWKQNNYRDLKGVILLLLPFIDDKNDSYLLKKITDLNQLIYSSKTDSNPKIIPNSILKLVREDILGSYFEYGNMGISLIPNKTENLDSLLNLYPDEEKIIYKLLHYNLIGLLQTLEIINGKSYINWVNIVPLNLQNYITSEIFNQTKVKLYELHLNLVKKNPQNIKQTLINNMTYYSGLWFGDIYNVLRIKLYEEAKSIKWLFFPYEILNDKFYLLQGLNKMIDVNSIINSNFTSFEDLDITKQYKFEKKIIDIITTLESKNSITGDYDVDIEVLKYTFIYLISNYLDSSAITGVLNKFKLSKSDEDQNDEEFIKEDIIVINQIESEDIINCLKLINSTYIKDLWNYIKYVIEELSITSYYKYLIDDDNKIRLTYYYEPYNIEFKNSTEFISKAKNQINIKNIYNIAKSLSHNNIDEWLLLEQNYISLNYKNKIDFYIKFYNRGKSWLNLRRNLKRQFKNIPYDYDTELNNIIKAFKTISINLVFEELITNGILNKFILNKEITDKMLLPKDTNVMKTKRIELIKKHFNKNKEEWLESYYYLTNDKFKNLNKIRLDKRRIIDQRDKYDEFSYFDIISKDHEWPVFYAMDWISQISFFQHYIYHQVLYVTGATGQGKSTQVPKLLLYALKAIDYKSNGKVICTQPRITPTIQNATRIAYELGLPIEQSCNSSQFKMKTNNYWVQFKHQKDSHINKKKLHSFLRIVTDGTLLEEMKSNVTLFQKININNKTKYINKNIYDIIIVDEAHEHNINMDIIITLAKQACYLNNRVKLVVVSATMDDDEPIYRRYFSIINDKLMYPIKSELIIHPIIPNIINFMPNPIFMDRRYHISPPGETTQYRVNEIYLDSDLSISNNEKQVAQEAQQLGYKKILDICSTTSYGEILFFANGKKEILDAVEHLNTYLPPDTIALPFFSELNEVYQTIIAKIDIKINEIKNKKENIHLEWNDKYIEDLSVPQGLYKRAVIIATNVAEASITIPRLTYVIDNGYAKVNKYKPEINTAVLEIEKISEASRLQRKGRVGRIGDGTVYYMYKKFARKMIKPKYKITQEDLSLTMLSLIASKELADLSINDKENINKLYLYPDANPNLKKFNTKNFNNNSYCVKSGLIDIYNENYKVPYNILNTIDKYYENQSFDLTMDIFNNGQLINNILDKCGIFYLIHPFENLLKRNILNTILLYDNRKSKVIPNYAYKFILNFLYNKNLLIDYNGNDLYQYVTNISNTQYNFVKTELAIRIESVVTELKTNISDAITLITASAMGCFDEVNEVKIFLELIGYSMKSLINTNIKWSYFKQTYSRNIKSDIMFIYTLIQKIKQRFSNLLVFNITSNAIQVILNNHCENILNTFKQLKKKYNEPPEYFNTILWNNLSALKNNGTLKQDYKKVILADSVTYSFIKNNIEIHKNEITNWCNKNLFNEHVIIGFISKYGEYILSKFYLENKKIFEWTTSFNSNFTKQLTEATMDEKIIRSFIYGRPTQFTYSKDDKGTFITLINFNHYVVTFAKSKFKNENETLTNLSNELTFYLSFTNGSEPDSKVVNVNILSQTETSWLLPALPLLINPILIPDIIMSSGIYDNNNNIDFFYSSFLQRFRREIINGWNQNILVWNSKEMPILNGFYKSIYKSISSTLKN